MVDRDENVAAFHASAEADPRDLRQPLPLLGRIAANTPARNIGRWTSLLALDCLGIAIGLFLAFSLDGLITSPPLDAAHAFGRMTNLLPLVFGLTALFFAEAQLYGPRASRPGLARTIVVLGRVSVVVVFIALVGGAHAVGPWLLLCALALAGAAVCALRFGYAWTTGRLLVRIGYRRSAVLVGTGPAIDAISPALGEASLTAYDTLGCFLIGDSPSAEMTDLGGVDGMSDWLDENIVEEVIIADPDLPQRRAVRLIDECQRRGIRVRIAPSTVEVLTEPSAPVPGEGVPLLEVRQPTFTGLDFAIKRVFDFALAALLLLLMSPFLLAIALLVRLTSRGPVLHQSLRPGIAGQPFRCLKFRTMYADAEERQEELEPLNEASGPIFKIRDDPRVTPVGRFLRRNSIDELPQLFNVLLGQLSLVGPRPLPLRDHARLETWHRRRYSVLPGITGLWQVSGRSNLTFDDMVRLDFLYIDRWSITLDLRILLKTIPAVIRRRGAY